MTTPRRTTGVHRCNEQQRLHLSYIPKASDDLDGPVSRATEFVAPQMTVVTPFSPRVMGDLIAYGKPCLLLQGGGTPQRRLRTETALRPRSNRPVKLFPKLNLGSM
ncbi:hypothetical protein PG990_003683 [Apiospora arundinis]